MVNDFEINATGRREDLVANPLRYGLRIADEPEPVTLVIFGATGDLTRKKLIPALFSLFANGNISNFKVVGFARRGWSEDYFRDYVLKIINESVLSKAPESLKREFLGKCFYISSTFESEKGYQSIKEIFPLPKNRVFYLATPPVAYEKIITRLGETGLSDEGESKKFFSRIIVEKPFGNDLDSAKRLNSILNRYFKESQIFRIDHYLGKETVQNIMVLRFGNGIFEPIWNNRYVDHVQITVAEKEGIGTRGNYYDKSGALRDIVQNHMMQLLSLVAMEPPIDLRPDTIRDEKVKVLESIKPIPFELLTRETVRGQYSRGIVDGEEVPGYREEENVSPDSTTETFVALRVFLDSWRWAGVPFYLRTGKRMSRRITEIAIQFKNPPHILFREQSLSNTIPNSLVMRIQPDEAVTISINSKIPGYTLEMRPVNMSFRYGSTFGEDPPEAYERLLLDVMNGDSTLYTRRDEIEASWRFITEILEGWGKLGERELPQYRAGSSGPDEAKKLLSLEGRRWRKL